MYTQQTQRIEVIVRKEGGGGEKGNKEVDTEEAGNGNNKSFGERATKAVRIVAKAQIMHGIAVAKHIANAGINFWVGGLGYENGDEAYQQRVSRQIEVVQDHVNTAISIGMGAAAGAMAGSVVPGIGNVVGFVVGGTLSAINSATGLISKYEGRKRDYNFKMFKENNAIEYKRARANLSLTTGRLR